MTNCKYELLELEEVSVEDERFNELGKRVTKVEKKKNYNINIT